jgi:hypothetical protein
VPLELGNNHSIKPPQLSENECDRRNGLVIGFYLPDVSPRKRWKFQWTGKRAR